MVISRKHLLVGIIGSFTILTATINGYSDTLFKARQPVKIGHGNKQNSKIIWTDCDGQNRQTFDEPPYSIDFGENCKVSPYTFGLECHGEACTVVDAAKAQKYLPTAQNGQKVKLHLEEHAVEIRSAKESMRLER